MTVKQLIIKLLDAPMDAEASLQDKTEHIARDGSKCGGYLFDITGVESWSKYRILLNFKDWRAKDEPQTNADQHVQHVENVEPTWTKEEHEAFYTFLWNVINPNEMQDYIGMFEAKDKTQPERSE